MSSLQKPPKQYQPRRALTRILVLVVLLSAVLGVVWTATTINRIDAEEVISLDSLKLETRSIVGGTNINVIEEPGGPVPVILLHDYDIAGGILWDGVVGELGGRYQAVRVDLPGFGMSDRIPSQGVKHTVASMTEVVAALIEDRYEIRVVVAGVGLGGKVAAELALTSPDLIRGLVLVDVDFWEGRSWLRLAEGLPLVGRAVTYTFETGGRMSMSEWAPSCDLGGWCPSQSQVEARDLAATIRASTDSMRAFVKTPPASLVPSDLGSIEVPRAYVWSTDGVVPKDSIDRFVETAGEDFALTEVAVEQAHLEAPETIAAAIGAVDR